MMAGYEDINESREILPSIRCVNCHRLLYRGLAQTIEIKCPKCGVVQLIKSCGRERLNPVVSHPRMGAMKSTFCSEKSSRLIMDNAGRIVTLPRKPGRVIALNASNLGLFYAAGGKVIGKVATNLLPLAILEQVKNVPNVGIPPCPDVAKIIAMEPDLVLGMHVPMHHNLARVLEKAGIPILLQALEHYTDVLSMLKLYGELSGYPETAAKK